MNATNSLRLISLLTGVVHGSVNVDRFKSSILHLAQNPNEVPSEELVREFGDLLGLHQLGSATPLRHEKDQEDLEKLHLGIFRSYLVKTLSS